MKQISEQVNYFFRNPFWSVWAILAILIAAALINGVLWFFYLTRFNKVIGITPAFYASAVMLLNLFLANIMYRKEPMVSFILVGTALLIQIFILIFMIITFSMMGVF